MFNLITGNPTAFVAAIVGGWTSITTVDQGHTGVVMQGETAVRELPSGAHFRIPFLERVVEVNTDVSRQITLTHVSSLANDSKCTFRVHYGFVIDDPSLAIEAIGSGRAGRYRSTQIESRMRTEIDRFAKQTTISDLDRDLKKRFAGHLRRLEHQTFADGTQITGGSLSTLECSDPAAMTALRTAQRPLHRPGPTESFEALSDCGEEGSDSIEVELPKIMVFSKNDIPIDLIGVRVSFRPSDEPTEHPAPYMVEAFTHTALSNGFRLIEVEDVGAQNICSIVLEDEYVTASLQRLGIELVALDPNTPQYAIHESIAYADDPAD